MEHTDLVAYTEKFPEQFASADTFDAFAASLDASEPGVGRLLQHIAGKYPGQWEAAYRTIKRHGFTAKPLLLPDATKAADIFADVALYQYVSGCYRHEVPYVRAGAAFVSDLNAPGFAYFGRLGASYVRNGRPYISGGKQVLTAAKPTAAVEAAYGKCGTGDWDLAAFEATRWKECGRVLIVCRTRSGIGSCWLCILDAGETATALLPAADRDKIAAERAREKEQLAAVQHVID